MSKGGKVTVGWVLREGTDRGCGAYFGGIAERSAAIKTSRSLAKVFRSYGHARHDELEVDTTWRPVRLFRRVRP